MSRIGIQVLSYNKPNYLEQTLTSLISKMDDDDILCVVEQSDEPGKQDECIEICKKFPNIRVLPLFKNFGQRGATNILYETGFWKDCEYVMLSDHDNLFHDSFGTYCNILSQNRDYWIATGYHSPEHDVENKFGQWILKSTCRAGHIVMRKSDFYSLMPSDLKAGSASWFAGLDWWCTHWAPSSPGHKRQQFVACLPGGVEHIGRESTWQGKYDDEYPFSELMQIRNMEFTDVINKYKPRHAYIKELYWYEKELIEKNISIDDQIKELEKKLIDKYGENYLSSDRTKDTEETNEKDALNYIGTIKRGYESEDNKYLPISIQFPKYDLQIEESFKDGIPIDSYLHYDCERKLLASIINLVPQNGKILEIGTWGGYNSIMLAQCRPDLSIITIDPYIHRMPGFSNKIGTIINDAIDVSLFYQHALKIIEFYNLKNVRQLRARSVELEEYFDNNYFDAIYIDGSHETLDVLDDLSFSYNKLKSGGIIFGHDSKNETVLAALKTELINTNKYDYVFYDLFKEMNEDIDNHGMWFAVKE